MFRRTICLVTGHRDQHVRNLINPSFPLMRESLWRCARCQREVTMGGWQAEPPTPTPLPPMKTLPIKPGTPELPAEGANDVTVA